MTKKLQVQGFLPDFPPIQLEGFGSYQYGSELVTILHQGSLTSTEYSPSIVLRINLETGAWSTRLIPGEIGFPKATAIFNTERQIAYFVDHDKENESTRLADGNWRGGYLYAIDLVTGEPLQLEWNKTRKFWHDLKEVDGRVVALAFDREFTLLDLTSGLTVNPANVGSFSQSGSNLIVAPYGSSSKLIHVLDSKTLTLRETIDIGAFAYIHETLTLPSVDAQSRTVLFQENFMNGVHYYMQGGVVSTFESSIDPRTIFKIDLNKDNVSDLVVGSNNGTRFFLNDGYGRLIEVKVPNLEGHFLVHPTNGKIVSFDWPSASPRLNLFDISVIDIHLSIEYAKFLDLAAGDFEMISGPQGVAMIQNGFAKLFHWTLFLDSAISAKVSIRVHDKFKPISVHALADQVSDSSVFLPIFDRDLAGLNLPDGILRVQTFQTFKALDLDGNAGKVAKVLGAVFGKSALTNKEYVGIGLGFIDGGMSYQGLAALAVSAAGKSSSTDVCTLLWTNVMGSAPTTADITPFKAMLDSGQMSIGSLTTLAADTSFNTANIGLVGLSQTGLEFV